MSVWDSWLVIAEAVALVVLVWLFANRVADAGQELVAAWREERA